MKIPRLLAYIFFSLPWLGVMAVIGWVLLQRFPASGVFEVTSVMDGKSAFINPFLPSERATIPGLQSEGWIGQRITGDPAYFTARVPGPYETAEVEIDFRPIHQTMAEFGLVRDPEGKDLELKPMFFSGLESPAWEEVTGGFVRQGIPENRLMSDKAVGLAVWDASSSMPLLEDGQDKMKETNVSLRGGHDFYFVPAGGILDVKFDIQDANRKRGNTMAVFRVFFGDQELKRDALNTNASRETTMGRVMEQRIYLSDLMPGVYRIALQADDDVFIRKLTTASRRWVFGPRFNSGDVVGFATGTFPAKVWTNSRHIVAETFHKEGLQTVKLADAAVRIDRTHEQYRLDRSDDKKEPVLFEAPQGDVRIVGDGWFAFDRTAFFEPRPSRITDGTNLDLEYIDGVKTSYQRPKKMDGEWLRAAFSYPLQGNEDTLRFVLSAPGLAARMGAIDVRRVKIKYTRPALDWNGWWTLVKQEIRNAWQRL